MADKPQPIMELPQEYVDRGWSIQHEAHGWFKAVNKDGRATVSHYMAKHRGLKFALREIAKMESDLVTPNKEA